jgi:hypothetical protein
MACVWRVGRAVVLILVLGGCGGGAHGVLSVPGDCTASEASLGFPAVAGFTASVHIKGQDCLDASNYQTRSGTSVIIGSPFTRSFDGGLPGGSAATVWLYLSYEFDNGEILASSPDVNVAVPAAILVPGRTFRLASFQTSAPQWFTGFYDAPIVRGTTLTFAGDGSPTTIDAKTTYEYALYSTGT